MKDWEIYEHQIFDKLKKDFPKSEILKDQKINGVFSKRSRQIDILIKEKLIGKEIIGVIDCKKFSKRINVKIVEGFIGFLEDIGANLGVMITNVGYSKSALNRIKNYPNRDIRLDIVQFKEFEDYDFSWDDCYLCESKDGLPRGEIIWQEPFGLVENGATTIIQIGDCTFCGEQYIKCQGCGSIIDFMAVDISECGCGNKFIIESEYVGSGMHEENVLLKSTKSSN